MERLFHDLGTIISNLAGAGFGLALLALGGAALAGIVWVIDAIEESTRGWRYRIRHRR